jgi:hypothetical protein
MGETAAEHIEFVQNEILEKFECDLSSIEDVELAGELKKFFENSVVPQLDEFSKTLCDRRDEEWLKNATNFEKQLKKLHEEREKFDVVVEANLILELRNFVEKQQWKKEWENKKKMKLKN